MLCLYRSGFTTCSTLKTAHNIIIKERKDWMEKKNGERKAVHKIITLFCLCMHFGVDEPQKVFGGPEVAAKIADSPAQCTARTY
jgi:hypothetical protein